ncbi:MAG: hypothetical protein ACK40O_13840 [Allosphingosinicella sp.]
MEVVGNYHQDGYALIRGLIPPEVGQAFLKSLKGDMGEGPIPLSRAENTINLLNRPAFEVAGQLYSPLLFFLWGLTPTISGLVGRDLLPTYDYLRIYREGDVCKVHSDRPSCEHSVSLTLDYSDGAVWDLELGKTRMPEPSARVDEDFGEEPYAALPMQVGDAVLYKGVNHRHGRTKPNPNAWSAHLFLHWVERDGQYADHAFDRQVAGGPVNFTFS